MYTTSAVAYIPWSWEITPLDSSAHTCPSAVHINLVYLATTLIITIIGLFIGSSHVARWVSCGLFGNPDSYSWTWMWIVQFGIHFGADVVVATFTISANGYDQNLMPNIGDLALYYMTRPRLAWIFLTAIGFFSPWRSLAKQTMICEIIMQVLGCYYFGRTAHFAAQNGYYSHLHYDHNAQLMYAGALLTLITTGGSILALISVPFFIESHQEGDKDFLECFVLAAVAFLVGMAAFVGRWLFTIGYVSLAGDGYCPPHLLDQALTWVGMNTLAMFLGAGI